MLDRSIAAHQADSRRQSKHSPPGGIVTHITSSLYHLAPIPPHLLHSWTSCQRWNKDHYSKWKVQIEAESSSTYCILPMTRYRGRTLTRLVYFCLHTFACASTLTRPPGDSSFFSTPPRVTPTRGGARIYSYGFRCSRVCAGRNNNWAAEATDLLLSLSD